MYISERTIELTRRFYEWERRGRGWDTYPYPVELEPPFVFPNIFVQEHSVDDTHKPSFLRSLFAPRQPVIEAPPEIEAPDPESFSWSEPLIEHTLLLPQDVRVLPESSFAWLESLSTVSSPVSFELLGHDGRVEIRLASTSFDAALIQTTLESVVPEARLERSEKGFRDLWQTRPSDTVVGLELGLGREFMLPLLSGGRNRLDPLTLIITGLSLTDMESLCMLQVLFVPTEKPWARALERVMVTPSGKPFFSDAPEFTKRAQEKVQTQLFAACLRLVVLSDSTAQAYTIISSVVAGLNRLGSGLRNQLVPLSIESTKDLEYDLLNRTTHRGGMILSAQELGQIVGLPDASVAQDILVRLDESGKMAPTVPEGTKSVILGYQSVKGHEHPVRLSHETRLSHVHIIGGTGVGKSTLMVNLILQDIEAGEGVAVIDPHGDLVDDVLARIPEERHKDVIVFDPSDPEYVVGWNILSAETESEKQMLASDLVGVFKRLATSWGDQMTSVLANTILCFLDSAEGGTISDLRRFLVEKDYRNRYLTTLRDPHLLSYWQTEFPLLVGKRPQTPILTRLDTLLRHRLVREVLSATTNLLNFRDLFLERRILLARLAQGAIGTENAALLGSLLLSKLHQTALSRQEVEKAKRHPFFVYLDEFHEVATPSMTTLFSGVRKYGLSLTVAHQDLYQLRGIDGAVERAVLSNAHTRLCFRVGDEDARKLSPGFSSFTPDNLLQLQRGAVIGRVGSSQQDFDFRTRLLPHLDPAHASSNRTTIISHSRENFGTRRSIITPPPKEEPDPQPEPAPPSEKEPEAPSAPRPAPPSIPLSPKPVEPPPPPPAHEKPPETPTSVPDGRGGPEHQYLQSLIREWAQARGYKVSLEHELRSGGRVDVVLIRDETRLACEVSVTTGLEHELENVRKCLEAGFDLVFAVSLKKGFLKKLVAQLDQDLTSKDRARVFVMTPEDFLAWLDDQPAHEQTVAGYTVRTRVKEADSDEKAKRRAMLSDIIGKSLRRLNRGK